MQNQTKQLSMEITVGLFLFLIFGALGFFTIILSSGSVFTTQYEYEVVFDDVMGLSKGDKVMVRGFEVGSIKKLWLELDGVHLIASLEKPLTLREDYAAEILSSSVLGGRYLQFTEGTAGASEIEEDVLLHGTRPVDIMAEAGNIFSKIEEALVAGGILDNLKVTMEEFKELSVKVNQGEGTLGRLIHDDTMYEDISALAKNMRDFSADLENGEGTLSKLIQDDTLYNDLSATAASLKTISKGVEEGRGTIGKLLTEEDELYTDLRESIAALKEVATRMNEGEGTLGRLMSDDALYQEAQILLHEIRAAVDDFRETAPITSFSSVFFGAF